MDAVGHGTQPERTLRNGQDFRACFCRAHACAPERFDRRVFWQCLPPGVKPVAGLLWLLYPRFFRYDFELIETASAVSDLMDVKSAINVFHRQGLRHRNFMHDSLRIRMSGRRLIRLFLTIASLEK